MYIQALRLEAHTVHTDTEARGPYVHTGTEARAILYIQVLRLEAHTVYRRRG